MWAPVLAGLCDAHAVAPLDALDPHSARGGHDGAEGGCGDLGVVGDKLVPSRLAVLEMVPVALEEAHNLLTLAVQGLAGGGILCRGTEGAEGDRGW